MAPKNRKPLLVHRKHVQTKAPNPRLHQIHVLADRLKLPLGDPCVIKTETPADVIMYIPSLANLIFSICNVNQKHQHQVSNMFTLSAGILLQGKMEMSTLCLIHV